MATLGRDTTISWLGHGTFHIVTPSGKKLLVDAWVDSNPVCPPQWKQRVRDEGLDAILITHAHDDHIGDLMELVSATDASVVGQFDLAFSLASGGMIPADAPPDRFVGMNKGGTIEVAGVDVTMVHAVHSSTADINGAPTPAGSEAGYVLRMENGFTIYHAGDTAVTMDMQIVGDLYTPDLAILPIGDHFTMGPRQAAYALKLIRPRYVIGGHHGTFPLLTGTPEKLRAAMGEFGVNVEMIELQVGESVS